MTTELLEHITLEPSQPATASVIWLHGLGASGHDFESVVPYLGIPSLLPTTRFIFPHAPMIPVSINAGMVMPAWYDIQEFNLKRYQDAAGILTSYQAITQLIESEIAKGIEAHRIILMGFSQGGAMALYAGLKYAKPLAGIACLSGYLFMDHPDLPLDKAQPKDLPILIAHGTVDPVVPYTLAQQTQDLLQKWGYRSVLNAYPMAHMVNMDELQDIGEWMMDALKPIAASADKTI